MRAVHFGAGNIGRGFIGPLLMKAGISVTFIDIDERKIQLLNEHRQYPVTIIGGEEERIEYVEGYRGISLRERESVIRELELADIITTSAGKEALAAIAPIVAEGIMRHLRSSDSPELLRLIVIACENVSDNTTYFKSLVFSHLDPLMREEAEEMAFFPNCVVDRIIPNTTIALDHPLAVAVEDCAKFVVDRAGLKGQELVLPGVELTDSILSVLEQKLFTLNMAHAIIGYYGYLAGHRFVHAALCDDRVIVLVIGALAETSELLVRRHGIGMTDQVRYAEKTLARLKNPKLADEVTRVARSPKRKLHPSDRLVAPYMGAFEEGMTPAYLATAIAGALAYDYEDDTEARELARSISERGIDSVILETASLAPEGLPARMVKSNFIFQGLHPGRGGN